MTKAEALEYQRCMLVQCLQEEQQAQLDAKVKIFRGYFNQKIKMVTNIF